MIPLPKHGLIPMFGQITRIEALEKHPVLGVTYTLHTRNEERALTIHYNRPPRKGFRRNG
jgi:hypothetical protein